MNLRMKKYQMPTVLYQLVFAALLFPCLVQTKTIYVDGKASNDNGNGFRSAPKKYIQSGLNLLSAGDTLIIKDGIYNGNLNIFDHYHKPPNGFDDRYTVVKAENVGQVTIDGESLRIPVELDNLTNIQFDGLVFEKSSNSVFSLTKSQNIKITRCGFCEANNTKEQRANNLFFRYVENSLVEDCYSWGNGKYRFYILDSQFIILRRCLDRFDRGIDNDPYSNLASFRIYGSSHTNLQNCISIDADANFILNNDAGRLVPAEPKLIYISGNPSTGNNAVNNLVEGCLCLNGPHNALAGFGGKDMAANNTIKNCVFWDLKGSFWARGQETTMYFYHCTFGNIQDENSAHDRAVESDYPGVIEIYDSIIYHTGSEGLRNVTSNFNALYGNVKNYSGTNPGYNDFCLENGNEVDPIDGLPGNQNPALKHLIRIEDHSDLDGKASDGGDIGATILKRIGKTGTIWGEAGYDEITQENLWPWPYEDIIQDKMKNYYFSDGIHEINGKRGFCAENTTLTNYILGYLGHTPPDVYPPKLNLHETYPRPGAIDVSPETDIIIHLTDNVTGIDFSSIVLTVNHEVVYNGSSPNNFPNTTITGSSSSCIIHYDPPINFSFKQQVMISITAADRSAPANYLSEYNFSFETESSNAVSQFEQQISARYSLKQNYPNPFNSSTMIEYDIFDQANVDLTIYNVTGGLIRKLVSEPQPPGNHKIHWQGDDETGYTAATGIYLCQLRVASFTCNKKLVKLD